MSALVAVPLLIIFIMVSAFIRQYGMPKTGIYKDYVVFALVIYFCFRLCGVL